MPHILYLCRWSAELPVDMCTYLIRWWNWWFAEGNRSCSTGFLFFWYRCLGLLFFRFLSFWWFGGCLAICVTSFKEFVVQMVNDLYEWYNDKKRQWWKMPWPNLIGISGRWKIETDCQRQKKENNMHNGWKFWIQQRMIHEPSKGQEIIENICPPGIRTLSFAVVDNYRRAFYPNKKWHPPQKKTATTEKKWYNLFT